MRTSVFLVLLLALAPPIVRAQQGDSLDEAARQIFENGRAAFAAGDYETALARFRQAYDLSHRAGLLYNIAQSLDRLSRDQETLNTLQQYLREAPDAPNRGEVEARIRVLQDAIRNNHVATPVTPVSRPPLHPLIFISVGGAAVITGGLGILFGALTLSANDSYLQANDYATALARYNDASTMQLLTDIFLFSAAGLAAGAVVCLFFTDWNAFSGDAAPAHARGPRWLPTFSVDSYGARGGLFLEF